MSTVFWAIVSVKRHASGTAHIVHTHVQNGVDGTTQSILVDGATPTSTEEMFLAGARQVLEIRPDFTGSINLVGPKAEKFIETHGVALPGTALTFRVAAGTFYKKRVRPALLSRCDSRVHAFDPSLTTFDPNLPINHETSASLGTPDEGGIVAPVSSLARFAAITVKRYPSKKAIVVHVHVQDGTKGQTRQIVVPGTHTQNRLIPSLHSAMNLLKQMTLDLEDREVYVGGYGSKMFLGEVADGKTYVGVAFRHFNGKRYEQFVKPYLTEEWQKLALETETSAFELPEGAVVNTTTARELDTPVKNDVAAVFKPGKDAAVARNRPHQDGAWAAISVKWHLLRNCDVIHVHFQDGEVQKKKRILVETKANSTDLYLQGLTALFALDPKMTFRSIHLAGNGADEALNRLGDTLEGTNITFHKLSLHFHDTVVCEATTSPSRRYAFDPTVPTYCDPIRIPQNTTTVHLYTDASQILGKNRTPGYGHGYTLRTDSTVEANSTWNTTPKHYTPHQFELHGMLTALDAATARYAPAPGTINKLRLIINCDNSNAVEAVYQAAQNGSTVLLETILGKEVHNFNNQWIAQRGITVEARWVKGHNGEKWNEATDQLAGAARLLHYGNLDYDNYTVNIHNIAETIGATVDRAEDPDNYPEIESAPDLTAVFSQIRNAA